jgi:GDP-4-dehydro-6-deoxy-D-mannose reductase
MDSILITGSNGFLGSHLIDFLMNQNDFLIYGLDRPSSSFRNVLDYFENKTRLPKKKKFAGNKILFFSKFNNLKFLECDIKNGSLLENIITEINPKYLFHFGAQPYILPSWEDPVDTIETNVIGTLNIFEPIKKQNLKTKVILACSATEFGTTTQLNRPLKETDPLMAIHPYGISKIAAELLSRQYHLNFGIDTINLRFFNLTGTRRTGDVASDFIRKIAQIDLGLQDLVVQVGNLKPYRDFLDVQDAVKAIWLAATKGKPGETYHICSGKKVQIKEILDISLSFSTKDIKVIENAPTKMRKFDEDIIVGDNSKITTELGWTSSIDLKDTLKNLYNYFIYFYKSIKK